jgi:hypothetical protein
MLCGAVAERMNRSWVVESCRTSVACGGQQAVGVWLQAMGGQTATLRARDAAGNCLLLVQALTEAVEGPVWWWWWCCSETALWSKRDAGSAASRVEGTRPRGVTRITARIGRDEADAGSSQRCEA